MDALQFSSSVIRSLAWPAVVLTVLIMLKGEIVALIARIKKLKLKDAELEFEQQIREIEIQVAPIAKRVPAPDTAGSERIAQLDRLYEMADISPRAAVVEGWLQVESALAAVASKVEGLEKNRRSIPSSSLLNILKDRGLIEPPILVGLEQMRRLRNRAIHATDFDLSAEGARKFLDLCKEVIPLLEKQEAS